MSIREQFDRLFEYMDAHPEEVDRAWEEASKRTYGGPTCEDLMRWKVEDLVDSAAYDIRTVGGIMPTTRETLFRALVMASGIIPINFRRVRDAKGERSEVPPEGRTEPREQPGLNEVKETPNNPTT